ncbi:MAG: hypothetical protein AAF668_04580 [Pseudomonadota bacterium]
MNTSLANQIAEALSSHTLLPEFNDELTLEQAYEIQHAVTQLRSPDRIGGIKAGVTSKIAQGFLKLEHALIGSLYADTRHTDGSTIPYLEGRSLECEVAVIVDGNGRPKEIAPAIEGVYVNYSRQSDMSAASLVTCNLGADLFIVGDFQPWNAKSEQSTIELKHDGDLVNASSVTEALQGPASATSWMWEEAIKRGFNPTDGTLLLTGACGTVVPAEPGQYKADFGTLGKLTFSVEAP